MKLIDFEDITDTCMCVYYQYFSERRYVSFIKVDPVSETRFGLTDMTPFFAMKLNANNSFKVTYQKPTEFINIELPLDRDNITSYQLFELTDDEILTHVLMETI